MNLRMGYDVEKKPYGSAHLQFALSAEWWSWPPSKRVLSLDDLSGTNSKLDVKELEIFPMGHMVWIKILILNERCYSWQWNLYDFKESCHMMSACRLVGTNHGIYHFCHHHMLDLWKPRRQTAQSFWPGMNNSASLVHTKADQMVQPRLKESDNNS